MLKYEGQDTVVNFANYVNVVGFLWRRHRKISEIPSILRHLSTIHDYCTCTVPCVSDSLYPPASPYVNTALIQAPEQSQ
jgi:hypothetical protein